MTDVCMLKCNMVLYWIKNEGGFVVFLTPDMCKFFLSHPEMLRNPFTLGTIFHVDLHIFHAAHFKPSV